MNGKSRKQVVQEAIGLGALAQLSRNKKINGIGETFIAIGLITLIGELIRFTFKWLLVKPIILFSKGLWICLIYTVAFIKTSIQFISKNNFKNGNI